MKNRKTEYSYGYGLVEFYSAADGEKAMDKLNTYPIGMKSLKLTYIKHEKIPIKLNVTNMGQDASEMKLRHIFSEYGEVSRIICAGNKNNEWDCNFPSCPFAFFSNFYGIEGDNILPFHVRKGDKTI